uniref:Uncharacterized protein n=1 Tax=Cacopsylla melanoneura TaxID=428564 RepID=A0A8D9BYA9_9HEMI
MPMSQTAPRSVWLMKTDNFHVNLVTKSKIAHPCFPPKITAPLEKSIDHFQYLFLSWSIYLWILSTTYVFVLVIGTNYPSLGVCNFSRHFKIFIFYVIYFLPADFIILYFLHF